MEIYSPAVKEEILAGYRIFTVRKLPTPYFEKDLEWIWRNFAFMEHIDKKQLTRSSEPSLKMQKTIDLFEFYWFSTRLLFLLDFGNCDL